MDEHYDMLALSADIRRRLASDDRTGAVSLLDELGERLRPHAIREERGLFAALKESGEFVDAILDLEDDHLAFDTDLRTLDVHAVDFEHRVTQLLDELSHHIDQENLGIFPVAVVTLGATGWATVDRAHEVPTVAAM